MERSFKNDRVLTAVCLTIAAFTAVFFVTSVVYAEGEVIRRAAGGALRGAAIGSASGGDAGKGAAWGAAGGAMRGAAERQRDQQEAYTRELETDNAYQTGYNDGFSGRSPRELNGYQTYNANQGQVARGAAGGALSGAGIAKLSDGDAGKGAAWGAVGGAVRGEVQKERQQEEAYNQSLAVDNAYYEGYHAGVSARKAEANEKR